MDRRRRVLIIEDNLDLLDILRQLLAEEYEVTTARGGEEGVQLATSFRPDVVILDLNLPQMDGIEAGRSIKREFSSVPILVLSAVVGPGEPESILSSGCCDAYLAKPATIDAIRAKVAELLRMAPQAHP